MNENRDFPIDPKLRIAVMEAKEAHALFVAMTQAWDLDGDLPVVLRAMIEERLCNIRRGLEVVVGEYGVPF